MSRRFAFFVALLSCLLWPLLAYAQPEAEGVFGQALAKGPFFVGLAAFGFGLLVSLTPCVYPMIAITVSVFGAQEAKSRMRSFALSGMFVLGLVAMFTPLGITAGLTGKTFGSELSNPWVVVGLSAFFLLLAASMFGAFDLDLPTGLKNRLAGAGGAGYVGAFVLGLACGPIAAPCTGPFLWGLLAFIAQTQSIFFGTLTMIAFSLGLGAPFFLVGAFAMQLPKSGRWMVHVKSVMGIVLVIVALYFLGNAFPSIRKWADPGPLFLGACAATILVGLALGAVHRSFEGSEWSEKLQKGAGVLLVCVAGFGFIAGVTTPDRTLTWEEQTPDQDMQAFVQASKERAKSEGRPVFLDFTADWCTACKEIEVRTFPDERVQTAAGRFVSVKLDMTDDSDPAVEKTQKDYDVRGLPTLILIDSEGKEAKRFYGTAVEPEQLVEAMDAVN
jgi:thiol:disulfide interchange protein DsbD